MRPRVSSRVSEGLLYALTAFGPFAFGCVEPWSRAVLESLIFALALSCFLRGRRAGSELGADFWLFAAAFAAFGALQLARPAAADGPRPWAPFTAAPHATGSAVLLWTAYAALLWSVPRTLVTHEAARRYVRFVFGLGLALAAFGLLQAATDPDKLYWVRATYRAGFGPYYNRDHAANVLLMSLAAGIGLLFSRARRGAALDGPPALHRRKQALIACGALLLLAGIVACGSRGALLALLLSGAALALLGADFAETARARRARAAAALAGGACVVFFAFHYVGASADAGGRVDLSIMGRFSIYGDARRMLRDAPLFGTGLGSFVTVYPSYQDLELRATVAHAHSDWLELALESGLLGLLAALTAAALAAGAAARSWRAARSSEMRALIGGGLAAAAAFSVHALFDFCFQIPGNAVFFLGIVGFLLSAPSWADKAERGARSSPPRGALALSAAACALVLSWAAARPAAAAWAAAAAGDYDARALSLARAYSWDRDPSFLAKTAEVDYAAALERRDVGRLRAALTYALAAVDARPFDFQSLSYAGAALWRLGRRADARALTGDAAEVRFSPLAVAGPDARTGAVPRKR
jgi:O-antigen ligase